MSHTNSAQPVLAVHEAFTVPPRLAEALTSADGPILLVDDLSDSGWTLAVAARLLQNGCEGGVPSGPRRPDMTRGGTWEEAGQGYERHTG
jgi:ATP-dependent DNA helicase RecQ